MSKDHTVYVICHERGGEACGPVKIGIAADPVRRLASLRTGNPHRLVLFWHFLAPDRECARRLERGFHETRPEKRMEGEWFDLDPVTATQVLCLMLEVIALTGAQSDEERREFLASTRVPQASALWQPEQGGAQ